jgi:hypothetical protein
MRLRQAADRNRARLRAQGASTPIRGRLGRRLLGNLVARAGEQRDDGQSLLPLRATNGLKSLVFSLRTAIAGRPAGAKNYPRNPQNRLEPFGDLRRLIGEQADKAGITAPIGAHAPPIPCADQRDPPGFPRPGGSVFWPTRLCSPSATRKRIRLRLRRSRACAAHKDYDGERFGVCNSGTTDAP